jgi:hypothetical protein
LEPGPQSELEKATPRESRAPLLLDFLFFLRQNKKWWLLPILLVLLLMSALLLVSTSFAAPFLYSLF